MRRKLHDNFRGQPCTAEVGSFLNHAGRARRSAHTIPAVPGAAQYTALTPAAEVQEQAPWSLYDDPALYEAAFSLRSFKHEVSRSGQAQLLARLSTSQYSQARADIYRNS